MSASQIRLLSLIRREVNRFMKIKRQTLGGPLLETFLYISVFGAALGTRIHHAPRLQVHRVRDPGADHDGLGAERVLEQLLIDPAAEVHALDRRSALIAGLADAAAAGLHARRLHPRLHRRGLTYIVAAILLSLPVTHALVLIPSLILVGLFFAQCGVLVGVRAEQFDDVALYQTFVLQPLIFLGGVFYGASLLPQPWQTLTKFNPVYYMIALVRYGFIGYHDVNIALGVRVPGTRDRGAVRAQLPDLRPGPVPPGLSRSALSERSGALSGTRGFGTLAWK